MDYLNAEKQKEEQRAILESLSKKEKTTESVNAGLYQQNQQIQKNWKEQTYEEHNRFMQEKYYPIWKENTAYDFQKKLQKVEQVPVTDTLTGSFENQMQPQEHSFWKNRSKEKTIIDKYRKDYGTDGVCFDKNTVREMAALERYHTYHFDYFDSREHQRELYENYTKEDKAEDTALSEKWAKNIRAQRKKYGSFFGSLTGALTSVKDAVMDGLFKEGDKTVMSRKQEMSEGLRCFFSMTKKTLFWKKQVGLLGTETKAERKDGSEYNKRLLRVYTTGKPEEKVSLLDELADKLMAFKLKPQMFTNQYLAKNMLQMQRYTDMLNGFVTMVKCNPEYLDTTNEGAAHTSPEMAALIKSRIILMAPIMSRFMEKHAKYYGYRKGKGLLGNAKIDGSRSDFADDGQYEAFVKETWEMVKQAHNSTADFLDDFAEVKMRDGLAEREEKAKEAREARKSRSTEQATDDSEFDVKYDITGLHAKKLLDIKNRIASNPYIYEIFGGELDRISGKINEMTRRLDEMEARYNELLKLMKGAGKVTFKNVEQFGEMWKSFIQKDMERVSVEKEILEQQILHYEKTVDYLVGQKLDTEDVKLSDPSKEVLNVLEFEGLNHVFEIKKAFEYNDMFYKTLGYYDFDKFTDFTDKDGNQVEIKDMWAQYNFTLLKRGMDRARMVNRLKDGKTTVDITDPAKLNNIQRRALCSNKFKEFSAKGYRHTLREIVSMDIEKLTGQYNLSTEMDITKDETYEKYFKAKSIADIGEKLAQDPTGKTIEGYDELNAKEKEELVIRTAMFKDYFKRWEGQMTYTRSEAYEYLGDVANMQGNNHVIEGLKKRYQKTLMNEMSDKFRDKFDKETDEETKRRYGELHKFMQGMVLDNDYEAKAIKLFGVDAYAAYKAKHLEEKIRKQAETRYTKDFEDLVKKGVFKGTEEEKKSFLKRVDGGITLRSECEKYCARKKENPNTLALDAGKTEKENGDYVAAQYRVFLEKMKTLNADICDNDYLIDNMSTIYEDVDFCVDFVRMIRHQEGAIDLLVKYAGVNSQNLEDFERYSAMVGSLYEYVHVTLSDYGIESMQDTDNFHSREECKRFAIGMNPRYSGELLEENRKYREFVKEERKKNQEKKEVRREFAKISKLYNEEEEKNRIRLDEESKSGVLEQKIKETPEDYVLSGKTAKGGYLLIRIKNPYAAQYNELRARKQSFETWDEIQGGVEKLQRGMYGIYDEKIELEEKQDGKKVDYLTKRKDELRERISELANYKPKAKMRNYSTELFNFIRKEAGDADLNDPEKIKAALVKARDAWFYQLSAGARQDAKRRLEEYGTGGASMSDYFVWKNSQETNEVLIERTKAFGQDQFIKENIGTIRSIMDTIAEANDCVNDMQTPEFLDKLTEDLELKGIDERQFMFLLRKHNVGFSGLSNTVKDAHKARKNRESVDRYFNVETKGAFLRETAKDVLEVCSKIDLSKVDEAYILEHFDDCYFNANKMLAFQQLYYAEYEEYRGFELSDDEDLKLLNDIKRNFDKGRGEPYALFHKAVMSVAKKYGVDANGSLSFGLSQTQLEKIYQDGGNDEAAKQRVADNLAEARKQAEDDFGAIKDALKTDAMAGVIQDARTNSLAGAEVVKGKRTRVGIDRHNDIQVAKLKQFWQEHTDAYNGAQDFVNKLREYENDESKVSYTLRSTDYAQDLFFMAKDQAYGKGRNLTANLDDAENFKNLFARDETNIARNLSVIDEEKCKRVMKRIRQMKLDKGTFGKDKKIGKKITEEAYLEQVFDKEFFEDMINAGNYCMMFEMNDDFLNLDGYEKQVREKLQTQKQAKKKGSGSGSAGGNDNILSVYEEYKEKLAEAKRDQESALEEIDMYDKQIEEYRVLKEKYQKEMLMSDVAGCEATIKNLEGHKAENQEKYEEAKKKEEIYEETVDKLYKQTGLADEDFVSTGKLQTLRELKKMFSKKENRFFISRYVILFQTYLMKNGIKEDGSFINSGIYDAVIDGHQSVNDQIGNKGSKITNKQALDYGSSFAKQHKQAAETLFGMQQESVEKGEYKKEYKKLADREKQIKAQEERLRKEQEAREKAERKRREEEAKQIKAQEEKLRKEQEAREKAEQKQREEEIKTIMKVKKEQEKALAKQMVEEEKARKKREKEEKKKKKK